MKDENQARDFIETALSGLEKSVSEKNNLAVNNQRQEFNLLISEYRKVIGTKSVNTYMQNYSEIIKNGGY